MWLTILVTFGVAVLSGLGVGSAGLLVVFLTMVEQLPQLTAQGINLIFFLSASGAALMVHTLKTPLLFGCILVLLLGGIPGGLLGAMLAHAVSNGLLRRLFGLFLIGAGSLGLFGKKKA